MVGLFLFLLGEQRRDTRKMGKIIYKKGGIKHPGISGKF